MQRFQWSQERLEARRCVLIKTNASWPLRYLIGTLWYSWQTNDTLKHPRQDLSYHLIIEIVQTLDLWKMP